MNIRKRKKSITYIYIYYVRRCNNKFVTEIQKDQDTIKMQ